VLHLLKATVVRSVATDVHAYISSVARRSLVKSLLRALAAETNRRPGQTTGTRT
jgi:hypothetical protein